MQQRFEVFVFLLGHEVAFLGDHPDSYYLNNRQESVEFDRIHFSFRPVCSTDECYHLSEIEVKSFDTVEIKLGWN